MRTSTVVLIALCLALGVGHGWQQRRYGRAEAATAQLRLANDSLKRESRRIDTLYRVQVDTFVRWRVRLDTLTRTVAEWKHDTVKVVEYVARADSTIRACSVALETCEQRVGVRDDRIRNLEAQIDAMPKPRAALWTWLERGAIGYIAFKVGQASAPGR